MSDNPQDTPQSFIPTANMSNAVPMVDDANKVITAHAALTADTAVEAKINKSHSTGSTINTGTWPILRKATTNSSGVATIYLTIDGTSGTAAEFSTVYEDGIIVMPVGTANNYQVASVVLSGDKKSIAVTVNTLSVVALGLVTLTTAPTGVEVRGAIWGK